MRSIKIVLPVLGSLARLVGISRWSSRVGACAALMADVYPPFRLDQGAREWEPGSAPVKVA